MITGDSYIGSNRQHRLSDQVSANTADPDQHLGVVCEKRERRAHQSCARGAREPGSRLGAACKCERRWSSDREMDLHPSYGRTCKPGVELIRLFRLFRRCEGVMPVPSTALLNVLRQLRAPTYDPHAEKLAQMARFTPTPLTKKTN